jgi:DNA-directed RNA polymerase subunit RPC12/RpoP
MSVSNENYRKMLFVMLVDAKYYKYFSTSVENDKQIDSDTVFYVRMTKSEIQKAAKVKYANQSEKDFFLGCINRKGLFDISDSKLCSWYIKFVDISNENIIESITDYDHLDLYYEKLSGGKIGKCEYCGNLFKQGKTKPSIYCYKHRGYSKQKIQSLICVDCGNEFTISSKSRNACRCENCQNERNKAKKAERNRRYYQTHRD